MRTPFEPEVSDKEKPLPDFCYRDLNPKEVEQFRASARANYKPGTMILGLWHPVYRAECEHMNAAYHRHEHNMNRCLYEDENGVERCAYDKPAND